MAATASDARQVSVLPTTFTPTGRVTERLGSALQRRATGFDSRRDLSYRKGNSMMVPSISITETVEGDELIFTASAVVDGSILTKTERVTEQQRMGVRPGIFDHQLRKYVAHALLEKMMNDSITES